MKNKTKHKSKPKNSTKTKLNFTGEIINKLEVIADIGAQNASKYLTKMTNTIVQVSIPWCAVYPYEKIPETAGRPQDFVVAVFMQMTGDISGIILMIFPEKDAIEIANLLQGKKDGTNLDSMGESALMEAGGNILANAYLNAFADKLNIGLLDSVPNIARDMLRSIMDGVLGSFASESEETIIFKNRFKIEKKEFTGNVYFLFNPESVSLLFKKLKKYKIN